MKNTQCHTCGGGDVVAGLKGPPVVLRCQRCGLRFLEEFPSAEHCQALYQGEYYDDASGDRFFRVVESLVRYFRRQRVLDILRHQPPARKNGPDAILDVGCGRGLLLEEFQKRGWNVTGTQVSRTAQRACERRLGAGCVRLGELPDLGLEESAYGVVTFYHVLEHLQRPLDYLNEAKRLLRPDGLLVVEVPDASGPGARFLGVRDFCLDYPHHLYFFTPASLKDTLEQAGFCVVAVKRFSLEYSPFTCLQNLLNLLPGEPNRFYRSLMRNREGSRLRRSPWTWLHGALALTLAAPAVVLSLLALFLPLGNTMRMYAIPGGRVTAKIRHCPPTQRRDEPSLTHLTDILQYARM